MKKKNPNITQKAQIVVTQAKPPNC